MIGNTGGDGVSHRNECADDARLSAIGGWADGTEVEVLEEGSGRCAGWFRVQANGVTSWVREQYLLDAAVVQAPPADEAPTDEAPTTTRQEPDEAPPATETPSTDDAPSAAIWRVIGNTGGDGVSHRNECADDARLSAIGGWADGTEVEVLEEGSGRCAGWFRVQANGVTSWVRGQYLLDAATAATTAQAEDAPTATTDDDSAQPQQAADPEPETAIEGTWVIANTGGQGVSHRTACREDARVSDIGGWPDGTEVELLERGTGGCTDWVRVRANGITSWVRDLYVVSSTADSQSKVGSRWIIGNTGGEGVSHREECVDGARVAAVGGWPDGTIVTAHAAGAGQCAGWLWVEADDVSSWVREEYLVESLGPAFPRTGGGPFE